MRQTAVREQELQPLQLAGDIHLVKGNTSNMIVVAIPAFTIPNGKGFLIEMNERNGGRHLRLVVANRRIIKASVLPDFK